ncbi:MAG: hypothetical protein HN348_19520, partial [Proteobacteria bacterium]|nr:hypothetical protein [Pseudomonadota bacterium]
NREIRGRRATEADSKHRFPVLESRPTEPGGPGVNREIDGTDKPLYRAEVVDGRTVAVSLAIDGLAEGVTVGGLSLDSYARLREGMSGDHDSEGIFVAVGPGVTAGSTVDLCHLDVAPILLAALGLGQGKDMTGAVPKELWPAVGVRQSWDSVLEGFEFVEAEEVEWNRQMLESLGYVDSP